jgi:hypothetical protein
MELKVKAFVARDKNGELYFYTEKPRMREDGTFIGGGVVSDRSFMPFIGKGKAFACKITVESED